MVIRQFFILKNVNNILRIIINKTINTYNIIYKIYKIDKKNIIMPNFSKLKIYGFFIKFIYIKSSINIGIVTRFYILIDLKMCYMHKNYKI